MNAQELEKITMKLKSADIRGWNASGNLNSTCDPESTYWWPLLSMNLGGLSFTLSKLVRGSPTRTLQDYTLTLTIDGFAIDSYVESTSNANDIKPIGGLYESVYSDLKCIREKEFAERISSFLADDEQHSYKPEIEKITAKLEKLDFARWRKHSYLDTGTTFTAKSNGLSFTLGTDTIAQVIKKDITYYYLTIENYEEDFWIKYKNMSLKGVEEKKICKLYNTLNRELNPYYHAKFKEKIDDLLSD